MVVVVVVVRAIAAVLVVVTMYYRWRVDGVTCSLFLATQPYDISLTPSCISGATLTKCYNFTVQDGAATHMSPAAFFSSRVSLGCT